MDDVIACLDDATAKRVLATIARAKFPASSLSTKDMGTPSAQLRADLATAVGPSLNEGEVARLTLGVLVAEDPGLRANVEALACGPTPQSLSPESVIAAVAVALLLLQTRFDVSRTSTGKWSFKIGKPTASDDILKALMAMVSRLVPGALVETPAPLPQPSADGSPVPADTSIDEPAKD